jgi:6-pyruvoyltetrahydropterin/6-carboxytetrahydropterin synthase
MKAYITKRFTFEASHQLPWHDGKCKNLHGHSYVLEVTVRGNITQPELSSKGEVRNTQRPDTGMVADFSVISSVVKPYIAEFLDHKHLNDLLRNPTAEMLLAFLCGPEGFRGQLDDELAKNFHGVYEAAPFVCKMRLYETETSWAEIVIGS